MDKVLFGIDEIQTMVARLATDISEDYHMSEPPLIIGVLKGAFMFTTDLIKYMTIPVLVDFVQVKSYKGTESTGVPTLTKDIDIDVKGKKIIIVDGIIDSGTTLNFLIKYFESKGVSSIATVVLLDKECKRKIPVKVDYYGWKINDHFAVGYGLDYNELYRDITYIKDLAKS